ncbi:MAG: exo-beta-N-acetylmuramidase NamZ family protein [Flavobacteriales bacterium]
MVSFTSASCQKQITISAANVDAYIPLLKQKKVGIVAHQASVISSVKNTIHLVDMLKKSGITIKKVFAPEHGFRGTADAGEKVENRIDSKTQLPIISLYGKNRKPNKEQLKGIEIMVFDLQDVGVRFYTYLSTLHNVMEACAENNIPLIVLDRPNPNAHYIDGPVLNLEHKSFVGMHPVPIVYGMTIGEYAQMINGEKWLTNSIKCDLTVIPLQNYTHQTTYELKVRPSPNLPNKQSIALYPSLCLLEPTKVSIGRGTDLQFQVYGHPGFPKTDFSYVPKSNFGSKNPKHKGQICYGENLTTINPPSKIELKWLMNAYSDFPEKDSFFLKGFERISGVSNLKKQLIGGASEKTIRNSWTDGLNKFKKTRIKYLLYP